MSPYASSDGSVSHEMTTHVARYATPPIHSSRRRFMPGALPRARDDDEARGIRTPAPEHSSGGGRLSVALVDDLQRNAGGRELVVRASQHHAVEAIRRREERS